MKYATIALHPFLYLADEKLSRTQIPSGFALAKLCR